MSNSSRHGPHHQFQHARPTNNSDTHSFPHEAPPLDLSMDPSNGQVPLDMSAFPDFPFEYDGMQPQADAAAVQQGLDIHHDGFPQHHLMTTGPGMAQSTIVVAGARPYTTGQSAQAAHLDDDANRSSPVGDPLDDGNGDEFGHGHDRADGTDLGAKAKDDKSDAPPAWSELKTKAGKERKRLPLACIACRRKKIRCSGEKPACKHCLRSRIPCVYKVTTRKAAPRTDYMAMLDKRLKRMEERIIKVIPKPDQESTSTVTRAVVKPAMPGALSGNKSGNKKRGADEAFGSDLSAWAKGSSRATKGIEELISPLQAQEADESDLLQDGREALPPKETQEYLAEVFFDHVYGQAYHLLHKPSYMRKLKNDSLAPVLVLSVCAIAARFASSPKFNTSTRNFLRGEEWAKHARDICTRRYEWPNITVLTCLVILGLHEFGTCQGGRSWAFGGQAIRMAYALQLHKDLDYDPMARKQRMQLSFIDREIRRRIMWACFLMDRFNSSGTERPMFIREETIEVPLPVKERYFQLDMPAASEDLDGNVLDPMSPEAQLGKSKDSLGPAAYLIRAVALWGRIITYLNQGGRKKDPEPLWSQDSGFAKISADVQALQDSMPDDMQYSRENLSMHITEHTANQFLLLHISLQHNTLFLNRAILILARAKGGHGMPKDFHTQGSSKTFSAANRISEYLRDAETMQVLVSAPFAGYCAFSSTTIHILAIFSSNAELRTVAETNSGTNIKHLQKMMKYWGMFHWMVENIRTQYRTAHDAAQSGAISTPTDASNGSMLQYGDWFSRYPHGVAASDSTDPAVRKEKGADAVLEQKPQLQSVEEFFTTTSQTRDTPEAPRTGTHKRKSVSRKQDNVTSTAKHNRHINEPPGNDMSGGQAIERRYSNAAPVANTPGTFDQVAISQAQTPHFHGMASVSPANAAFPQHLHDQQNHLSPDQLSMSLAQQTVIMQPLDRQLAYEGGYSMDQMSMAGGQGLMDGYAHWNNASPDQGANDAAMKTNLGAPHAPGHPHMNTRIFPDFDQHGGSSSAWFLPFNMAPPEPGQEMNLGTNSMDGHGIMMHHGPVAAAQNPMGGADIHGGQRMPGT